jgi:hypothetical protein
MWCAVSFILGGAISTMADSGFIAEAKSLVDAANEYYDATMKRMNEVHSMIDKVEDAAND